MFYGGVNLEPSVGEAIVRVYGCNLQLMRGSKWPLDICIGHKELKTELTLVNNIVKISIRWLGQSYN